MGNQRALVLANFGPLLLPRLLEDRDIHNPGWACLKAAAAVRNLTTFASNLFRRPWKLFSASLMLAPLWVSLSAYMAYLADWMI